MQRVLAQEYSSCAHSIIAVHGLGGGAFSTWRHPESGIMWLRDLLPTAMRMSRIMSYGYDAKIYKNRSTLHMMDNAENLLFEVQAVINSKTVAQTTCHPSSSVLMSA